MPQYYIPPPPLRRVSICQLLIHLIGHQETCIHEPICHFAAPWATHVASWLPDVSIIHLKLLNNLFLITYLYLVKFVHYSITPYLYMLCWWLTWRKGRMNQRLNCWRKGMMTNLMWQHLAQPVYPACDELTDWLCCFLLLPPSSIYWPCSFLSTVAALFCFDLPALLDYLIVDWILTVWSRLVVVMY
jgi:hypothetical protein